MLRIFNWIEAASMCVSIRKQQAIAKIDNCQRIQIENLLYEQFGLKQGSKRSRNQFRRSLAILAVLAIRDKG
jgi:hypothetical protein